MYSVIFSKIAFVEKRHLTNALETDVHKNVNLKQNNYKYEKTNTNKLKHIKYNWNYFNENHLNRMRFLSISK